MIPTALLVLLAVAQPASPPAVAADLARAVVAVRGFMESPAPGEDAEVFVETTGFFFDARGYLFTAYAPLVDRDRRRLCPSFEVVLDDGRELAARGWNMYPLLNLAVLVVDDAAGRPTAVLELARRRPLDVGDALCALVRGPDGAGTTIAGNVAARSRNTLYSKGLADLVTDVHLTLPARGLGAPLFDARGHVAGLCVPPPVTASPDSLGPDEIHALPVLLLLTVQKMIMAFPTFEQPWAGFSTRRGGGAGLLVAYVWAEGPATGADIRVGDRLRTAAGERLEATTDLERLLRELGEGRDVEFELERDGQSLRRSVAIERRPPWAAPWIEAGDEQ